MNTRVREIAEVGILVSMAVVLELIFSVFPAMPQGGRVSISMLPLIVIAWRRGFTWGIIGGVVYGTINQFVIDGIMYHWASYLLDYLVAFGGVGVVVIMKKLWKDNVIAFEIGIFLAYLVRFISSSTSGVLIFGEYADGNVYLYSMTYNATYLLPALILTLFVGIGVYFPIKRIPLN